MESIFVRVTMLVCLALFTGCGDDDGGGGPPGGDGGASGASGSGGGDDLCHAGCVATLAADCDNGPSSLAVCESDCAMLAAGPCATEYGALQTCADGEAISCSAQGIPTIEACATEQSAFVACLN